MIDYKELSRQCQTTVQSVAKRGFDLIENYMLLQDADCMFSIESVWPRRDWILDKEVFTVTSITANNSGGLPKVTVVMETNELITKVQLLNPFTKRVDDLRCFIGAKLITFKPTVKLRKLPTFRALQMPPEYTLLVESLRFDTTNALADEPEGFVTKDMVKECRKSTTKPRHMVPIWSPEEKHSFKALTKHRVLPHSRKNKKFIWLTDLDEFNRKRGQGVRSSITSEC